MNNGNSHVDLSDHFSALATSAAPIYFKPFERGHPTKLYSDGALHANLPVEYAMSEIQKIWPPASVRAASEKARRHYTSDENFPGSIVGHGIEEDRSDDSNHTESDIALSTFGDNVHLDALVSIGTGEQERKENYPSAFEVGGLKQAYQAFTKAMDTESLWNEFKRKEVYNSRRDARRDYRLNVPITKGYVRLDDWRSMPDLIETVRECYRSSKERLDILQDTASQLTASLLYFEPISPRSGLLQPKDRWHKIHGQIWCRLARNAPPIRALIDRIVCLLYREKYPSRDPSAYDEISLRDGWKSEIRSEGKHFSIPVTIKTTDPNSVIEIAVKLKDVIIQGDNLPSNSRTFPISGFPVVFKDLEEKVVSQ